jgi:hypothetical protein
VWRHALGECVSRGEEEDSERMDVFLSSNHTLRFSSWASIALWGLSDRIALKGRPSLPPRLMVPRVRMAVCGRLPAAQKRWAQTSVGSMKRRVRALGTITHEAVLRPRAIRGVEQRRTRGKGRGGCHRVDMRLHGGKTDLSAHRANCGYVWCCIGVWEASTSVNVTWVDGGTRKQTLGLVLLVAVRVGNMRT